MSTQIPLGNRAGDTGGSGASGATRSAKARLIGAWLFVGIPLTYGVVSTVRRAAALFTG